MRLSKTYLANVVALSVAGSGTAALLTFAHAIRASISLLHVVGNYSCEGEADEEEDVGDGGTHFDGLRSLFGKLVDKLFEEC